MQGWDRPVFVSYRRADEPFTAALLGVALQARLGAGRVFLDTLSLRSQRFFAKELMGTLRSSAMLVVVIGPRWDNKLNRDRLGQSTDWVRREIAEAREHGITVLPVLIDRGLPGGLPEPLRFLVDCHAERIVHRPEVDELNQVIDNILAKVPGSASITGGSIAGEAVTSGDDLLRRATLAMVRHQLPPAQRRMSNDALVAEVVADQFDQLLETPDPEAGVELLQFAAVGRSLRRPRGSGVVMVTDRALRMIDLESNLKAGRVTVRPFRPDLAAVAASGALDVVLTPRRRAWLATADIRVRMPGHEDLDVLGMFRPTAELLQEALAPDSPHGAQAG